MRKIFHSSMILATLVVVLLIFAFRQGPTTVLDLKNPDGLDFKWEIESSGSVYSYISITNNTSQRTAFYVNLTIGGQFNKTLEPFQGWTEIGSGRTYQYQVETPNSSETWFVLTFVGGQFSNSQDTYYYGWHSPTASLFDENMENRIGRIQRGLFVIDLIYE